MRPPRWLAAEPSLVGPGLNRPVPSAGEDPANPFQTTYLAGPGLVDRAAPYGEAEELVSEDR